MSQLPKRAYYEMRIIEERERALAAVSDAARATHEALVSQYETFLASFDDEPPLHVVTD